MSLSKTYLSLDKFYCINIYILSNIIRCVWTVLENKTSYNIFKLQKYNC